MTATRLAIIAVIVAAIVLAIVMSPSCQPVRECAYVTGDDHAASQVCWPTMPSTVNPFSSWKLLHTP